MSSNFNTHAFMCRGGLSNLQTMSSGDFHMSGVVYVFLTFRYITPTFNDTIFHYSSLKYTI